jgi:hypothetical protein
LLIDRSFASTTNCYLEAGKYPNHRTQQHESEDVATIRRESADCRETLITAIMVPSIVFDFDRIASQRTLLML